MKPKKFPIFKPANLSQNISFETPLAKRLFTNFTKALDLSVSQTHEILDLYKEGDAKGFDNEMAAQFLSDLDKNIAESKIKLAAKIKSKWTKIKSGQTHQPIVDRFKTALPVLAHILRHTKDVKKKAIFEQTWLGLKNGNLFLASKGVATRDLDGAAESDLSSSKVAVRTVAGTTIYKTTAGSIVFTAPAAICVDGAPDAYGPNDSGSDLTAYAGHNKGDVKKYKKDKSGSFLIAEGAKVPESFHEETKWWAVVIDKEGKPLLKPDGYYISTTAYVYSGQSDDVQERYVNANNVPFSVLSEESRKALGLKMGDLVHVKNTKNGKTKWTGFLETRFGDDSIGEISSAAADALGINSNPRNGGQEGGIIYTFYPNTSPTSNFKNDAEAKHYIFRNGKNIDEGKPVDRNPRIP